jgi:hypothetical protein
MASYELVGLRIDARGHVPEVLKMRSDYPNPVQWRWYKLDGSYTEGSEPDNSLFDIRVDARGHVREVLIGYEGTYRWIPLGGPPGTPCAYPGGPPRLLNLRLDARGHVLQVQMANGVWYDLNGEAA